MNLVTIPLKNMRRRLSRTLLLLLVFSIGVTSIVGLYLVSQIVGDNLERKLTAFGANIIVSPSVEKLRVSYGGFNVGEMLYSVPELDEKHTVNAIKGIDLKDRISVVAPKLVSATEVGGMPIAAVGVDWEQEKAIKSYWAVNGNFPATQDEVLAGSLAAEKLGLSSGDTVSLYGRAFLVSGVLHQTGSDDDSVILFDINKLQDLDERQGTASFVEVTALCAGCPIGDIVSQIQRKLPDTTVTALQNVVNQRMTSVHFVQQLALAISLVILVTASAMVGITMLSNVNERKKDIGILRSLGYSKVRVFLIFCLEAFATGSVAGGIGYLVGFGASHRILDFLSMADGAGPHFSAGQFLFTSFLFAAIAIVSALYPAWKGAGIEPSQALVAL